MNDERAEIEKYFDPESEIVDDREELLSPSGKFRLLVRVYETRKGSWSCSRGTVYRVAEGNEVCDILRNYSMFHHTFVTKAGREWLLAGRSYMSQTIVCLDDGREFEPPGDQYDGSAYCWAKGFLSPDGNTLAVDGCHWACPYEYKFFDFTDPASGWPELPLDDAESYLEVESEIPPVWKDDTTFECYAGGPKGEVAARTVVRRDGNKLRVVERWVDPEEQARREERRRKLDELNRARAEFEKTDPLYLQVKVFADAHELRGDWFWGRKDGQSSVGRWFRQVDPKASADLEWGMRVGSIQLRFYDERGNLQPPEELARTPEKMAEALARILVRFGKG